MAKVERYSLKRQTITLNEAELKDAIIDYLIKHKAEISKDSQISIIAEGSKTYKEESNIVTTTTTILLPTSVNINIIDENPVELKTKGKPKSKKKV